MVQLRRVVEPGMAEVWVKLEGMNPGGSIKDRTALGMVIDAEDRGLNDRAVLARRGRAMSSYRLPAELAGTTSETNVWVITDDVEDPDTATTILWPSDY